MKTHDLGALEQKKDKKMFLGPLVLYSSPLYGQYGDVRWTEHCQSTESRHTRHKRDIIKRHLISTNRNIHPYIVRTRTPGKFKLPFSDLITGRHNTALV